MVFVLAKRSFLTRKINKNIIRKFQNKIIRKVGKRMVDSFLN